MRRREEKSSLPRLRRVLPRRREGGQALVEFAIALPVLVILVAGVLELGRGYAFAVETSDAARDAARFVAGKTASTNGPGLAAMCNLITADLAAVTTNITCPTQVNHAPPFVVGTDYTKPTAGQALGGRDRRATPHRPRRRPPPPQPQANRSPSPAVPPPHTPTGRVPP